MRLLNKISFLDYVNYMGFGFLEMLLVNPIVLSLGQVYKRVCTFEVLRFSIMFIKQMQNGFITHFPGQFY